MMGVVIWAKRAIKVKLHLHPPFEELGYFKNNGICAAHGRKTRMMEKVQSMLKAKESGNDEVWRARLMESELRVIKFMIVIICLFEFCNMLMYISKVV
ncbi:transmembrane protein, putative [Medicago truncatula]|uniref:Transmembrane protein, putative n=1 Tax=Medicago truncatula TaxID=3880 RepID=A0A072VG35_MEDTR|nr:transmembrane protein, putative [Medicago truncatula]